VVEINNELNKKNRISLLLHQSSDFFINNNRIEYYKKELSGIKIDLINSKHLFPDSLKYPYVFKITKGDTSFYYYEQIYELGKFNKEIFYK
jgi:hypothetical protein